MVKIQVDMFEVQLGSAILLQFDTGDDKITVLADAGIDPPKTYKIDHVHKKLPTAFSDFANEKKRIDLIIGTHYDTDHLNGLVPIINDISIDIGEAWLPPVANDTEVYPIDEPVNQRHLLANQFASDEGEDVLLKYLRAKQNICEELHSIETIAHEYMADISYKFNPESIRRNGSHKWNGNIESALSYFKIHFDNANDTLGYKLNENNTEYVFTSEPMIIENQLNKYNDINNISYNNIQTAFIKKWEFQVSLAKSDAINLAYMKRSAAKDAINALSLSNVVRSLHNRNIPIRCHIIQDGNPRRFVWKNKEHRFIAGKQLTSYGPDILLLGPSQSLVKKHSKKLPHINYSWMIANYAIPIKSITPSNQLSYILRIEHDKQGILISGDAGCVDFFEKRNKYYPDLLKHILPLHIIQVAHHAGSNAYFYRVLLEAKYPEQKDKSYLLLSHATNDYKRPSEEFSLFIEEVRKDGDDIQLLFTCKPIKDKVKDYLDIIYPVVGQSADQGDVQLIYNEGWQVKKHSVKF